MEDLVLLPSSDNDKENEVPNGQLQSSQRCKIRNQ